MRITACDHCGAPITDDKTRVVITIFAAARMFDPDAPSLNRDIDLHIWCYQQQLLPYIEANIGAPT